MVRLESVILTTKDLQSIRDFYTSVLRLQVGAYEKDGILVEDADDDYVNFEINGMIIGFHRSREVGLGSLVFLVDLEEFRTRLTLNGQVPFKDKNGWIRLKDPDGRTIILQAI